MTNRKLLDTESLRKLVQNWRESGKRVVSPRRNPGGTSFEEIEKLEDAALDRGPATLSAKSLLFPRVEPLFEYRSDGREVQLVEIETGSPVVAFGLRPCDARGLVSLGAIFNDDPVDSVFQSHRERTTIVSLSCKEADGYCFCTSVEGGPGDVGGSDLLLTETEQGRYLVEIVTARGQQLVNEAAELFEEAGDIDKEHYLASVPARFDSAELTRNLPQLFSREEFWTEQSLRCLGCGACAFSCPACACFDIQDEGNGDSGVRLRCWDSCGFGLFTLHASGHNPRESQSQRWRQRVMHKFSYMPERLSTLGCVGCGRCSRSCPADMNLLEHLQALAEATL